MDAWLTLRRAGLPLGAPVQPGPRPTLDELKRAVEQAVATRPTGRPRDALVAFVLAWRRHWPHAFARAFGDEAARLEGWARESVDDPNRYLKLARIASEHLATVL